MWSQAIFWWASIPRFPLQQFPLLKVTSGGVCKLGDFGCSVGLAASGKGPAVELTGTPGYQVGDLARSSIHTAGCILNYYLPGARTSKGRRANKSMWRVQSWNSSVATWLEEHSVSRPASPGSFSRLPFNLLPSDQVVMFQVVSMVARPRPPASSAAAIGLPEFVSLYSTCWAATPCERWIWSSTQELEGGL